MLRGWLKRLLDSAKPPLASEYIAQFLAGELTYEEFNSNIGDGWVGSGSDNWDWLQRLHDIARRYDPDFPWGDARVWEIEQARQDLHGLMEELRAAGR